MLTPSMVDRPPGSCSKKHGEAWWTRICDGPRVRCTVSLVSAVSPPETTRLHEASGMALRSPARGLAYTGWDAFELEAVT